MLHSTLFVPLDHKHGLFLYKLPCSEIILLIRMLNRKNRNIFMLLKYSFPVSLICQYLNAHYTLKFDSSSSHTRNYFTFNNSNIFPCRLINLAIGERLKSKYSKRKYFVSTNPPTLTFSSWVTHTHDVNTSSFGHYALFSNRKLPVSCILNLGLTLK